MTTRSLKRIEDIEVRWTESFANPKKEYMEIVRWDTPEGGKPFCYTLASWDRNKEGWELKFCGNRPMQYDNHILFMVMATFGQEVLDADHKLENFREINYEQ